MTRHLPICFVAWLGLACAAAAEYRTLVSSNDWWRYNQDGVELATNWTTIGYDHTTWPASPSSFGVGEPVVTTLTSGRTTYYFRNRFAIADPAALGPVVLRCNADDGAIVYWNGNELYRYNMPAGAVSYTNVAATVCDETNWFDCEVPAEWIVTGSNVIAVEVHQAASSGDMRFIPYVLNWPPETRELDLPASTRWQYYRRSGEPPAGWRSPGYDTLSWSNSGEGLTLVNEGRPNATLIVGTQLNHAAWFAASELQRHIKLITGATLPLVRDTGAVAGVRLYVGESTATLAMGFSDDDYEQQEYSVSFRSNAIVFMGNDTRQSYTTQSAGNWTRVPGRFGQGLQFDGDGDAVAIPASDFPDRRGSFEAWVYVNGTSSGSAFRPEGNGPWNYHELSTPGLKIRYGHWSSQANGGGAVESADLAIGWHYVLATWDADLARLKLYVDATYCGEANYSETTIDETTAYMGIGAIWGYVPSMEWNGTIDEIRISTIVRPAPSQTPTNAFVVDNDTLALLHCDEAWGGPVIESGFPYRSLPPPSYDGQGSCYAAYDFLQDYCGVRWYAPTALGMCYPEVATLTVSGRDLRRRPSVLARHATSAKDSWGLVPTPTSREEELFLCRVKYGGLYHTLGHTMNGIIDRFWASNPANPSAWVSYHPEYFTMDSNSNRTPVNVCWTSTGLLGQVIVDARNYFNGTGHYYAQGGEDWYGIEGMDVKNSWCQDPGCTAKKDLTRGISDGYGDVFFSSGQGSNLKWEFINEVARQVRQTHPGKYIMSLAYFDAAWFPTNFTLEANVMAGPCIHTANWWAPGIRDNDLNFYKDWVRQAPGRVTSCWLYQTFPKEIADRTGDSWTKHFPAFHGHTIAMQSRMYARDRVLGIFLCGIAQYIDRYVTLRTLENADVDVDSLLDEFFALYYGSAADPMRHVYLLIEDRYMNVKNYPSNVQDGSSSPHQSQYLAWGWLGTQSFMDQVQVYVDQAQASVSGDKETQRVNQFVNDIWQHMLDGFEENYGYPP